jgi:hypothetical protein
MPLYIVSLLVAFCILPILVLTFPLLLAVFPGICNTLVKVNGNQPKEYFDTFMVQFSLGSITVQGQLHYLFVSQILIGLVTLMIGSLLQVMYLLLVHDLLLGIARNKVPLLSLPRKQSIVQHFRQVRKSCGFGRSCHSLVLSSNI